MSSPINHLRKWVNRFGYDVRRYVPFKVQPIDVFELAVRCRRNASPDFFFVQVGANDGAMLDPIYPLVKEFRLKGLLVEPMPDFAKRLRENYLDQPQLVFEECAISTENGERELFRLRQGAYNSPYAGGLASFDRNVLIRHSWAYPNVEKNIEVLRVPTLTISSLFAKHGVKEVDLLLIDTEGFDAEVVRMVLAAGIRPAILQYEHRHLSVDEMDKTCSALAGQGYSFHFTRFDTLAILNSK